MIKLCRRMCCHDRPGEGEACEGCRAAELEPPSMTPRASRVPVLAILAVAVSVGFAVSPLWANDSSAELSVGGLLFTKNADVSMESEELTISPEQIIVR